MTEYIKREDAIKSFVNAANQAGNIGDQIAFRMIISEIPTADVVEVVRCKDCKHATYDKSIDSYDCRNWGLDGDEYTEADDFCSYGERKEE